MDSISEEQVNRELISGYREQIADNEVKLDEARRFKATLYENFVGGLIGKKDYQDLKGRYTARAEQAQRAIDLLREEIEKAVNNNSDRLRWTQHFKEFSTMTELDRRAVIAMVQSIRVVGKEDLEITFRYMSEYEQALANLARSAKAERRAG